jgi:hypothetical protein
VNGSAHRAPAGRSRRGAHGLAACAAAAAVAMVAAPAWALEVGGALGWDLARTESNSDVTDSVQESFGQTYRVNLGGAVVDRRLASWHGGVGWRRDLTSFSGIDVENRDVTVTDFDFGVLALPATLPISFNLRRSRQQSDGGAAVVTDVTTTTASLSTQVPMPDGNPLGLSAYESIQDPGTGTSKSRLVSVYKRFDLTASTDLSSAYQYSRYTAPSTASTGHAVSLSSHTAWSPFVSSNLFGNVSSHESTTTRSAGGRSLFLNNSAGGGVFYRRARDASGSLTYSYTESPQDRSDNIQSHLLAGRGDVRLSTKTDLGARFTARRLELPTVTMDTATANMNIITRPRFGWSTGGSVGLATNQVSGAASTDRNSYTASTFLNALHTFDPVQIDWGGNLSYANTQGDFAQDRLTTSAHAGVTERRMRLMQLSGAYRFLDIRQNQGGGHLEPYTQDHGFTITDNFVPVRGLWLPSDVISGGITASTHFTRQYQPDRHIRTTNLNANAKYVPLAGLVTAASFELYDNSADLGGVNEVLRGSASWSHRAFQRGSARFSGEIRRTWQGGSYESQESGLGFDYDYAIGLLHVSFTAAATFTELPGAGSGTDTTSVRLNIVRTF